MKVLNNQGLGKLANVYWLSFLLAMVVGCSSGGGKSDPPDTTPARFSFAPMPEAELGGDAESSAVTITGINQAAPVTVSNGEYSINNGAYTSAAGTISNGQSLKVKAVMPDDYEQSVTVTVTVGGVSASFVATTQVEDFAPDNLSFTAATGVALNAVVESPEVVIAGINTSVDVSITNGEYAIDGGSYTSEAGTLENGESIKVRVTASSEFSQTVTAELTVGEVSANFDVTTEAIDLEPDTIVFDAQNNVTVNTQVESNTVTIAGLNTAAPVSITGGDYSIDGGTYTADAGTISNGQTLSVRTTSSADFSTATTATVTVGDSSADFVVTTEAEDTQPDAFSFTPVTGAALSTEVESNSITVAGINSAAAISITGGEYALDEGTYTSAAGTVTAGQSVTVKLMSSASFSTATTATLVIGGVSADFVATTVAQDLVPDPVSFTPVTGADFGVVVESNAITVSGINAAIDISITGGEYNAGAGYTNLPGTITDGTVVMVRATSSNQPLTEVVATLTLNQMAVPFSVTTKDDDVSPEVSILFPPPISMTEGSNVLVRGTATDVHSDIDSLSINGVVATSDDNFATWSVEVPLMAGEENILVVDAIDSKGNSNSDVSVAVTQAADLSPEFPAGKVVDFQHPWFLDIYQGGGELKTYITDRELVALIEVDLLTGDQKIISGTDFIGWPLGVTVVNDQTVWISEYVIDGLVGPADRNETRIIRYTPSSSTVELYATNDELNLGPTAAQMSFYGSDNSLVLNGNRYVKFNIDTKETVVISSQSGPTIPENNNISASAIAVIYDDEEGVFYGVNPGVVTSVAPDTGFRTIISSDSVGTGTAFSSGSSTAQPDLIKSDDGLIVVDRLNAHLLSVLTVSGDREIFSGAAEPDADNAFSAPWGIATGDGLGFYLVADSDLKGVLAVDKVSKRRVVVTKGATTVE